MYEDDETAGPGRYAYARAERLDLTIADGEPGITSVLDGSPLASRAFDAVLAAVNEPYGPAFDLLAVVFRDGRGDRPFPANPWSIPPTASLPEALDILWGPIGRLAPRFRAAVHRRVLGLALLRERPGGGPALGYLTWEETDDRHRPHYPYFVFGTAPRVVDPGVIEPLFAGPVPRPMRDLLAVHGRLGPDHLARLGGNFPRTALDVLDGDWDRALERTRGVPPDRLVGEIGREDFASHMFDLDVLDAAGNPTVVRWDWKDGTGVSVHRPFWDAFDDWATRLVWR